MQKWCEHESGCTNTQMPTGPYCARHYEVVMEQSELEFRLKELKGYEYIKRRERQKHIIDAAAWRMKLEKEGWQNVEEQKMHPMLGSSIQCAYEGCHNSTYAKGFSQCLEHYEKLCAAKICTHGRCAAPVTSDKWTICPKHVEALQAPLKSTKDIPVTDPVNHPAHYTTGKFETIDVIEDMQLPYHLGNVVKYIARAGKKNHTKYIEDLQKARWYLDRYITLKQRLELPTWEKHDENDDKDYAGEQKQD